MRKFNTFALGVAMVLATAFAVVGWLFGSSAIHQILTAVYTLIAVVAFAAIAILNELPKDR